MSDKPEGSDRALDTPSLVHELRQPLFALRGRLQLLHESGDPIDASTLRALVGQLDHIESLLDYYGGGMARLREQAGPFDVRVPVGQALDLVASRAEAARVGISSDAVPSPIFVEGHPTALRQVLVNVLKNAIDAVSYAQTREIRVRVSASDDVEILVEDTGIGVPDEVRRRLFEPFVTTKPPGKGSGLGLFISRRRIEDLGGQVTIEPGDAGGTHVRVVLPRALSGGTAGTSGS